MSLFFFWTYRRIVLNILAAFHQMLGNGSAPLRLRQAQILYLSSRHSAAEKLDTRPDRPTRTDAMRRRGPFPLIAPRTMPKTA